MSVECQHDLSEINVGDEVMAVLSGKVEQILEDKDGKSFLVLFCVKPYLYATIPLKMVKEVKHTCKQESA